MKYIAAFLVLIAIAYFILIKNDSDDTNQKKPATTSTQQKPKDSIEKNISDVIDYNIGYKQVKTKGKMEKQLNKINKAYNKKLNKMLQN